MKIARIEAIPFVLPYKKRFEMASGLVSEAAHVLLVVETDDGLRGYAEAMSRPMIYGESQASIIAATKEWFAPGLVGTDPFDVEGAQLVLRSVAGNETVKGAIDIALHDIVGKALGAPVWRILGASTSGVRVTRMLSMASPEEVAGEAAQAVEEYGITSFKVKIDANAALGARVLQAVRLTVGDAATIYADANQSLTVESALLLTSMIADVGIEFLEEPISATDFTGRARLAGACSIPLLVDESARTAEEAGLQLTHGSARAISIKTARTGYTESGRIIGLARGLHARTVVGSQGDSAIGAISGAALGAAYSSTSNEPAELDYFLGLTDQLVTQVPAIKGGWLETNQTLPGTGVTIDEDKLNFYRTDK